MNILCISTFFKGQAFLKAMNEQGHAVFLITHSKLKDKPWPWESIKETFYLDFVENTSAVFDTLLAGTAHLYRQTKIDLIVALDDFDVEKGAFLRENFRIKGMGQTTARFFRDKLAMREQAKSCNIAVPAFSSLFHDLAITDFLNSQQGPWLIKPRSEASAAGIKKVHTLDEAWAHIHTLGDNRHNYLIEAFKPGNVYHVDALIVNHEIIFEQASQYLDTPFEVAHGGGIFRSVTVDYKADENTKLLNLNREIVRAFNMKNGVVHTEIIRNADTGEFYFLETASRVGGAYLAEMVEAATRINLWAEWAKIESAVLEQKKYHLGKRQNLYAGILVTLSSHMNPDYALFQDEDLVWTMPDEYHIGLIVKSKNRKKVVELLDKYVKLIFDNNLHAAAPAPEKPNH
jgi:hypothetical protein